MNNLKTSDMIDLYCVDCKYWTKQKYRGVLVDGSQLFLCKECGCENSIDKQEQKLNIGSMTEFGKE